MTRTKYQLTRDRARLQSQLESLLEECQIKLSSVVTSGQRILCAPSQLVKTDPARLRAFGDKRLHETDAQLKDALSGQPQPAHRTLLTLYLQRLDLIEAQIAELERMIADAMKTHEAAIVRLSN